MLVKDHFFYKPAFEGGTLKYYRYYPPGENPVNYLIINQDDDGSVEGIELPAPKFSWSEIWTFPVSSVTPEYLKELSKLTGSVNSDSFLYPEGANGLEFIRNVLFLKANSL
jgi:hypothetical protein